MSTASLRQAQLPGTRPLYADLLESFTEVGDFYPHPPSIEAACSAASEMRLDPAHRRRLADELARQNPGRGAKTLAHLDRLGNPGTVVVATGQQVGLLGGPVFTLYKALTAVRCAEELCRRGVSAVPVFWLATEDHDLAEVNHVWTFRTSGEPRRIEAATVGEPGAAVGEIRVADAGLAEFEELCDGMPHAAEAVALARQAYAGAPNFGDGFRALYRELLAGTGILFLCPMQPEIRALAAPLLRRAIERAPELSDLLLRRGTRLQAAGYHEQVHFRASTSLLLLFENAARVALKRRNGAYWFDTHAYAPEELLLRLDSAPTDVSPNALLRPVMQDYLLPTAALVAGPAEAAYLGQSAVLYENLLGRMPAVLPRASFTAIDSSCKKLLCKYRLAPSDCMVPRRDLEVSVASTVVPPSLDETLSSSRASIRESLDGIEAALGGFDPTLAASFNLSRRKIEYQLGKIRSKVSRESLRRSDTAQRHAAKLADFLYPNGNLQERVFGVLTFVARFGLDFVERVREETEPGRPDHKILEI